MVWFNLACFYLVCILFMLVVTLFGFGGGFDKRLVFVYSYAVEVVLL